MSAEPRLALRDLELAWSTRKGVRQVLKGLSFSVQPGEIFGLLGPNGSGKSTTFSILTGLLAPQGGEIRLDGKLVRPGARELRAQMGVVFQSPSLDINLTCRENLQLAARLHGVPRAEWDARFRDLLDLADLSERAAERVKTLSGGMKRRLELARALVHRPRLLLLDEPTTGLDEASFERTWQRLQALRDRDGTTLLLTTHRPEEAARCDRLALLDGGRIVACDTPASLQSQVRGDVITLSGGDPATLADTVRARFGLEPTVADDTVRFTCERGHELIPRLVEAFPPGRLTSVNLTRPSLGDVFLKLTGRTLSESSTPALPGEKRAVGEKRAA